MKKLLSLALVLCFWTWPLAAQVVVVKHHAAAGTPVTSVQVNTCSSDSAQTANCSTTGNVTLGNNLVLAISYKVYVGSSATISSITSTSCQNNVFTVQGASLASIAAGTHFATINTQFATAPVTAGGACTVTINLSAAPGTLGGINAQFREVTAGTYSLGGVGTNANTNVPACGSFTPSTNGSYVMVIGGLDDGFGFGTGWFLAGSPFTLGYQFGGGNFDGSTETYSQTTAGLLNATFGTNFPATTGPNVCSAIYYHE